MEPQTNQFSSANPADSPTNASTMPIPAGQTMVADQNPPVPAQAPPMMPVSPLLRPTVPVFPVATTGQQDGGSTSMPAIDPPEAVSATPADAADAEVIEREWVTAAKNLVAQTKNDPYKQVLELNKLKADYMKKRYNKDIKLPDA